MSRQHLMVSTVFLDALGYGLLIPVLPAVVRRFGGDAAFVSRWLGYFIASYAVVQFFAAPVLGALSDRFGRRPVLLVSLAGAAADYLLMAFAPNLVLLFAGRMLSGLTGANMAVANAFTADTCAAGGRAAAFGRIGAAMGIGIVIGPSVGGALAELGFRVPFLAAASLNLLNFSLCLLLLPESLPRSRRRAFELGRHNAVAQLIRLLRNPAARTLAWCMLLLYLAGRATSSLWPLYTEHRYGWTSLQVGFSLGFIGLVLAAAQGSLPGVLVRRLGDMKTLRIGLVASAVSNAAIGLATRGWMLYVIIACSAVGAVVVPSLHASLSKLFSASEQGELQGSLASMVSATAVVGPLLYTTVFGWCAGPGELVPGAPFLLAAGLCGAAWLLARRADSSCIQGA